MSDIRLYTAAQASSLVPLTGDVILCTESFNSAPANSVHLCTNATGPVWKSFANDEAIAPFLNAYSLSFDGDNDYLSLGAVAALNSAANFSVSMWVNFQTFVANNHSYNIFLMSGTTTDNRFALNAVRSSDTVANSLEVYFCEATPSIVGTSLGLTNNTWYHMAVYKSGSNMSLYIDNTLIASRTNAPTSGSATGSNFVIGRGIYGGSYSSNILADELAVWNSDQSSNKDSIYNNGTPGDLSTLNPTGWWRMGDDSSDNPVDGGAAASITDSSGNGQTATQATASSQPIFSTDVPS